MGQFAVGDVVVVPFPYADLTKVKNRPALVVGIAEFDNLILCQITSKANTSQRALMLENHDFRDGNLSLTSYIRPDKLFTLEQSIIQTKLGSLKQTKINPVKAAIKQLFV